MNRWIAMAALFVFSHGALGQTTAQFRFSAGQRVYISAFDMYNTLADAKLDLQIQRHVLEQFSKEKKFKIASAMKDADFVFMVLADPTSTEGDELALAIPLNGWTDESETSVEGLKALAAWERTEHSHQGKEAGKRAMAGPTMGASLIFARPATTEKVLVKKFHKDVLK